MFYVTTFFTFIVLFYFQKKLLEITHGQIELLQKITHGQIELCYYITLVFINLSG